MPYFLTNSSDKSVLSEAVWSIGFYLENSQNKLQRIDKILELGVTNYLILLLDRNEVTIIRPVLRIFGHLSFSSESKIMRFMTTQFVEKIVQALESDVSTYRYDASWIISNLVLTNAEIYATFFTRRVLDRVFHMVMHDKSMVTATEAAHVLLSFVSQPTNQAIQELVMNYRIVDALLSCLEKRNHATFISALLSTLESLLEFGSKIMTVDGRTNAIGDMVTASRYFHNLDNLQKVKDKDIYSKVNHIICTYLEPYFLAED